MPRSNEPVALVTGAARRIGAAIARRLHADGLAVAIHCQNSRVQADALAASFNATRAGSASVFVADLRAPAAPEALVAAVQTQFGRLEVLVNNASSYFATPIGQLTTADFDELLATNVKAPVLLIQAAVAAGGLTVVVNLLDAHSRNQPRPGFAAYTAGKDALWALTEMLAVELAPAVRVNGVALGHIDAQVRASPSAAEQADLDDKAAQLPRVPLQRLGREDEVAAAVAWLVSDESRYLTGVVLPVDGGRRLV